MCKDYAYWGVFKGQYCQKKVSNDNIAGLPIVTVLPILTLLTRIIG